MKVLLLAYDLGSQGGVGTFNYELATELSRQGVEVTVIARGEKQLCRKLMSNLEICTLPSPLLPPKDITFYLINASKIIKLVKRKLPDAIHDASSATGVLPYIDKIAPIIVTIHGSPLSKYVRMVRGTINDKLRCILFDLSHRLPMKLLTALHNPSISKLVFVSKSCLIDTVIHIPQEKRYELLSKSTVIYSGLSLERIAKIVKESVNSNSSDIIFVGRLVEYKGVDRLIKAFKYVVRELPHVKLHIVGSGPELSKLIFLSKKLGLERNVLFHGWQNRNNALKLLALSHVLVHPSLYESFGYVLIEAYALGKPVIAHKAPYSKELVEGINTGLTVNTFNIKKFAETILTLLTDPNLYKQLKSNAYNAAKKYFSIEACAKKYIEVYKEVSR